MNFTIDEKRRYKTIFRPQERRLDSQNAGELKAEFLLLAQPEIYALIVDLTAVEQIDSAGLSALLLGQRQMRLFNGELRLAGMNESIRALIELTQLNRMFPIYDTVEEAVESRKRFFLDPELPTDTEYPDPEDEDETEFQMFGKSLRTSLSREDEARAVAANYSKTFDYTEPHGPNVPSSPDIRLGAIASGGPFGAATLTNIMLTPKTPLELEDISVLHTRLDDDKDEDDDLDIDDIDDLEQDFSAQDDDDEGDDDDDGDDDLDSDDDDDDDDTDAPEDLDEDFEDDDWDEDELDDDDEDDDY